VYNYTIQVLHTYFNSKLAETVWAEYIHRIPPTCQAVIERYVKWQDRQSVLLGKILVLKGLRQYIGQAATLEGISQTAYGRPFLRNGEIDFNISHSGGHVICAFAHSRVRVGIDIETIRPIELSDFKSFLTSTEWDAICNAENPCNMFFTCWTKKESVMKADGRGLSIPLHHIIIEKDTVILGSNFWFLNEIKISPFVECHLASNMAYPEILVQKFDCHKL
jgi:4'-phosphopantetheinyl transferase